MAISNRFKSVKAWLGLLSLCCALTTEARQAILHSISDIMAVAVAADVMDMDTAECSISRILPVRHPRYRDNNTCAFA